MKSKIIYLLSVVLYFSCNCQGQTSQKTISVKTKQAEEKDASQTIKNFYVSYASNVSNGFDAKNDLLMTENMTQELIAKVYRMREATQSDPIIRAQDFNSKDLNYFNVKHLGSGWYMVSYTRNPDRSKRIEIPVKAIDVNGKFIITYITPEWNNSQFGDSLMCTLKAVPQTIDSSNPMSLLKTFYDAYTIQYCAMPIDLSSRLNTLCKEYCTLNALDEIQKAREKSTAYDLMINYFDFDILWRPTLTFTHLKGDEYKVSYTKWQDVTTNIYISIIKKDGIYFIDNISAEENAYI